MYCLKFECCDLNFLSKLLAPALIGYCFRVILIDVSSFWLIVNFLSKLVSECVLYVMKFLCGHHIKFLPILFLNVNPCFATAVLLML